MAKVALLIGVSDYKLGLQPLPAALRDIEAMRRVLQDAETGGFQVTVLANPDPSEIQKSVDTLFSGRDIDDLALLFFSGHGIKDDFGKLFFGTSITEKKLNGELMKWTAVPASYIHDTMKACRCRRQVVILDCCFSGAFADGLVPRSGHDTVDLQTELGGEGRAILTSSTSTQLSFEQQDESLSIYTRYVVEGIETGAADMDQDGVISIEELHKYARQKVFETAPAMKPEIYVSKEGYNIHLAQTRTNDPALEYRRAVEGNTKQGEITALQGEALEALRENLNLSPEQAQSIEAEVLHPFQIRKQKIERYQKALTQALQRESTLSEATRVDLRFLQKSLGLRDEDVTEIKVPEVPIAVSPAIQSDQTESKDKKVRDKGTVRKFIGIEWTPPKLKIVWATSIVLVMAPLLFMRVNSSRLAVPPNPLTSVSVPPNPLPKPTEAVAPTNKPSSTSKEFFNEGNKRAVNSDFKGAVKQYTQAINVNREWGANDPGIGYYGLASAYESRGSNLTRLGDPQSALKDLKTAISLQPDYGHAYEDRGDAQANLNDNLAAFGDYNQAAKFYQNVGNHHAAKIVRDKAKIVATKS